VRGVLLDHTPNVRGDSSSGRIIGSSGSVHSSSTLLDSVDRSRVSLPYHHGVDLKILLLIAAAATALAGVAGLILAIRGRSTGGVPRCRRCWYDVSASKQLCPECGQSLPPVNASGGANRTLFRRRRAVGWIALWLTVLLLSPACLWVRRAEIEGWKQWTPTDVLWLAAVVTKSSESMDALEQRLNEIERAEQTAEYVQRQKDKTSGANQPAANDQKSPAIDRAREETAVPTTVEREIFLARWRVCGIVPHSWAKPWRGGLWEWQWAMLGDAMTELVVKHSSVPEVPGSTLGRIYSRQLVTDELCRWATTAFSTDVSDPRALDTNSFLTMLVSSSSSQAARDCLASDECFKAMVFQLQGYGWTNTTIQSIIGTYAIGHPDREQWLLERIDSDQCDDWRIVYYALIAHEPTRLHFAPQLRAVANDPDASTCRRLRAILLLGEEQEWSDSIGEMLVDEVASNHENAIEPACTLLRRFGSMAASMIPSLIAILHDEKAYGLQAAYVLGRVGRTEPELVKGELAALRKQMRYQSLAEWVDEAIREVSDPNYKGIYTSDNGHGITLYE
jgi:hypothetical protein